MPKLYHDEHVRRMLAVAQKYPRPDIAAVERELACGRPVAEVVYDQMIYEGLLVRGTWSDQCDWWLKSHTGTLHNGQRAALATGMHNRAKPAAPEHADAIPEAIVDSVNSSSPQPIPQTALAAIVLDDVNAKDVLKVPAEIRALVPTLPDFEPLRNQINEHAVEGERLLSLAARHGLEIGRLMLEYSERPEIKSKVDGYNAARREKGCGGADKEYHTFVSDCLIVGGCKLTKFWLDMCARGMMNARAYGLPMVTPVRLAIAYPQQLTVAADAIKTAIAEHGGVLSITDLNIEGIFPVKPKPASGTQPQKPKFKDFILGFIATQDALEDGVGQPAIRNARNQELWKDACEAWWQARGVKVSVDFAGK